MWFYVAVAAVVVVSAAALAWIVGRKLPQLALIDVDALPKEKEQKRKNEIIGERANRLAEGWARAFLEFVGPIASRVRQAFRRLYRRVRTIDESLNKPVGASVVPRPAPSDLKETTTRLMLQAIELLKDDRVQEAEKKYIEIISVDPANLDAFRGLGQLYMDAKNYAQAKETYEFLVKAAVQACCGRKKVKMLIGRFGSAPVSCNAPASALAAVAKDFFNLGLACRAAGDTAGARLALEQSVAYQPSNPRHLDMLIETCIVVGDRRRAAEALEKLREVNPENQKIAAFEEKIASLPVPDAETAGRG
jgi:tetratricopeptide (TPR) repeat protein